MWHYLTTEILYNSQHSLNGAHQQLNILPCDRPILWKLLAHTGVHAPPTLPSATTTDIHWQILSECTPKAPFTGQNTSPNITRTHHLGSWYYRHSTNMYLTIHSYNRGSFTTSPIPHTHLPHQPQWSTLAHAVASVATTTINTSYPNTYWMDLSTKALLSRVQPRPAAYGNNNVTNNTAELLTRVTANELVPLSTPVIIIYDSAVVHSQHPALLGSTYTTRQRTRTVFPAIRRMLAQRLEASRPIPPLHRAQKTTLLSSFNIDNPTLHDTIVAQIHQIDPYRKTWNPDNYITNFGTQLYGKIKSNELRSNGHPKYNAYPQPCLVIVYINH